MVEPGQVESGLDEPLGQLGGRLAAGRDRPPVLAGGEQLLGDRVPGLPSPPEWTWTTSVTNRRWSRSRATCTITSSDVEAIRAKSPGSGGSAIRTICTSRSNTPRAETEWMVHMTPAMPLLAASSRCTPSSPRVSPTTSTSGESRSDCFSRAPMVTCPRPSELAGRAS